MVRWLRHLLMPDWVALRAFPKSSLARIGEAIRASERRHRGELCFVVEASLPLEFLRSSCRARAEDLFGELRVWDTEENSGVLIYVQLLDRDIEIVADRGVTARVAQDEWEAVCRTMERAFRNRRFLEGTLAAIESVTEVLERHFPPREGDRNELSDKPVVL